MNETDKMFVDTVNQILDVEEKNFRVLSDNCRGAMPHRNGCEICITFERYKMHNDAIFGMGLYPRPTIDGIDEYWAEHKDHLIQIGKFHHIPYNPLISEFLISETLSDSK